MSESGRVRTAETPRVLGRKALEREKRATALKLRLQGKPFADIAKELSCAPSTAKKWVEEETARLNTKDDALLKNEQLLSAARMDYVISQLWARLEQGDTNAASQIIKAEERRSKLLGLDAPA